MKQPIYSKSHQKIVEILEKNDIKNLHGGVQLFANQFDKQYSISVNFNSTGLHVDRCEIDECELDGDELIRVCKTWFYEDK